MLTRTLATLTLLLTLTAGAEPAPPAAIHLDAARAARRAHVDDDVAGCREAAPAPVPSPSAASCSDEGQP